MVEAEDGEIVYNDELGVFNKLGVFNVDLKL